MTRREQLVLQALGGAITGPLELPTELLGNNPEILATAAAVRKARETGNGGPLSLPDLLPLGAHPSALVEADELPVTVKQGQAAVEALRALDREQRAQVLGRALAQAEDGERIADLLNQLTELRDDTNGEAEGSRRTLSVIHWSEIAESERPPYLVKGVIGAGGFSVVYGEPGAMKSFVALDLALHIALGRSWHGYRVRGGPALYVACEGGYSIEDRLAAFCQHYGIERASVPFYVLPQAVNLGEVGRDAGPLAEEAKRVGARSIVVDTLSRALSGGNENSPEDMGTLVSLSDAIRRTTGAHLMLIHHCGKDKTRGARGHSLLTAAVDTEIEVTKADGICVVRTTKQRDLPETFEIGFRWIEVEVGTDEDGEPITSLVLEPTEDRPAPEERLSKTYQAALDALWSAIKTEGVSGSGDGGPPIDPSLRAIREGRWRDLCDEVPLTTGTSEKAAPNAFRRAKDRLLEVNKIGAGDGWVWPWPKEGIQ